MRKLAVFGVMGVMLVGATLVPPCRITQAVATTVVAAGLGPVSLEEMSKYRVVYRRALFNALPVAQKRALWGEQLALVRATETLTPMQQQVLADAEAVIQVAYDPAAPLDATTLALLEAAVTGAFPDKRLMRRLTLLGPDDRKPVRRSGLRLIGLGQDGPGGDCECWRDSDCPEYAVSCGNGESCDPTWVGCGQFWLQQCTKKCYYGYIYG